MTKQIIMILLVLPFLLWASPALGQEGEKDGGITRPVVTDEDVSTTNDVLAITTQTMGVVFNPTGTGRCEVQITTMPEWAQTAVNRAAAIWSTLLNGPIPIQIDICWTNDPSLPATGAGLLASCGASGEYADFAGAPLSNLLYPLPLANQLSNQDRNGSAPDMQCRINANRTDWYTETDGVVPAGKIDLVTVALHEIGHGLGFAGTANWDNGAGLMECNGTMNVGCYEATPMIYDHFVERTDGTKLLDLPNNTTAVGSALTGDALVFSGSNAIAANGGTAPRLQAPGTWVLGSSYVHLREEVGDPDLANGLMTPSMSSGVAIQHPGVVALGMLKDMGWEIYDLSRTYVDRNNTGLENGGVLHPFNTVLEGISAVPHAGRVLFFTGNYPESLIISRQMTLESISGPVVIGIP
ncbi:MAG: hypothetical protein H6667_19535 [Ardenticatenaceae bacterium]|nr:hypothetical protein [Ardenticatenaceae bacterium]MCB9446228.1 hypothetical protein [Ardenticatenaceae bacterium]